MEQEHQIPQQISSYQFRLVGDMTIKQFFQVAGGALISLILYSSGLPSYIKWPLIVVSFLLGVALAFFPLEDRPLSIWIIAFFRSIYSPTVYHWKKLQKQPVYFQPESTVAPPDHAQKDTTMQMQQQVSEPLQAAIPSTKVAEPPKSFPPEPPIPPTPEPEKAGILSTETAVPHPELEKKEQEFLSKVTEHFKVSEQPVVPVTPVTVKPPPKPVVTRGTQPSLTKTPLTPSVVQKLQVSQAAQFSSDVTPPTPSSKANIIVGQVVGPKGEIVESAILEIKDADGRPVRALKSNKLGHFMIVTPLINGKYEIITEREGLNFAPISFSAEGTVIPPIAIKGSIAPKQAETQVKTETKQQENPKTIYQQ
jgi:hypothetical protein